MSLRPMLPLLYYLSVSYGMRSLESQSRWCCTHCRAYGSQHNCLWIYVSIV